MTATSGKQQEIQRLWSRGEAASSARRWREAADAFAAIIVREPGHLPALLKSSGALLQLDSYRAARESLLSALKLANDHPGLVMQLGRKLRTFHEADLLLDLVRRTSFVRRADPRMLTEMSLIVSSVGDQELALQLVTQAVTLDPHAAQPHYLRGTVLMFLGRMEEAEAELENSIQRLPTFAQAHWVLSRLRKWSAQENHVDRIRIQLDRASAGSEGEAYLAFALHNELHDLKRFDESWTALERGCRAKRGLDPYDEAQGKALFEQVKAICTPEFVAAAPRNDAYTPIFIVGMHRSGTTLLERILSGHSLVADGGETYAFTAQLKIASNHKIQHALDMVAVERLPEADFGAIGRGFIDGSRWRTKGKPFLTEKLPPNYINAGFIAKAIPDARIIHMVRDPVDTCFSNLRTYFSHAALYSFDQITLANHFREYRDLMQHWRDVMPARLFDIHYEQLVSQTELTTRGIFDFCGLPFEKDALRVERESGAVSTASSAHVRQGILTNRGAAWRPYERYLQPMLDRLSELGVI